MCNYLLLYKNDQYNVFANLRRLYILRVIIGQKKENNIFYLTLFVWGTRSNND